MLHKSVLFLVAYFRYHALIQKENEEWCVYAIEKKVITWTLFVMIFIIACFITEPKNIIVILICIVKIRKWSGGYHCNSVGACFFLSLIMVLVAICAGLYMETQPYIQMVLIVLGTYFLKDAPIDQPALHLSPNEIYGNRKRLRIVQVAIWACIVFGLWFKVTLSAYAVAGYFIASISVIAARLLYGKRRIHHESP